MATYRLHFFLFFPFVLEVILLTVTCFTLFSFKYLVTSWYTCLCSLKIVSAFSSLGHQLYISRSLSSTKFEKLLCVFGILFSIRLSSSIGMRFSVLKTLETTTLTWITYTGSSWDNQSCVVKVCGLMCVWMVWVPYGLAFLPVWTQGRPQGVCVCVWGGGDTTPPPPLISLSAKSWYCRQKNLG